MTTEVIATLVVETPSELINRYYPNGKLGGLRVDGKRPAALGSSLTLTVKVKRPAREFNVRGQLAWVRHEAPRQPPSFGVDFLPAEDGTRVRLLAFARDEVPAEAVRAERRVPVELPVRLLHDGHERREVLADLSTGGAFVRTPDPLAAGELVQLFLKQPGSFAALRGTLSLKGYVAWSRNEGEQAGMGIEFVVDEATRAKLQRLLARLDGRLSAGAD
jgi:uncharacterized protein (TIGR02266 family)